MNGRGIALAAALAALPAALRAQDSPAPIVIPVYHTNDVHGWIMPHPRKQDGGRLGGAAALKSLLDKDPRAKLVLDAGADALRALIGRMNMPVLAANIYGSDGKHAAWTKQRIIKEVGGVKFGIFGLLTAGMDRLELPENIAGLTFRREIDEARDQVRELKKEGAEVVIAVTHVGFEAFDRPGFEGDRAIAREVSGIDLIVGGHSHSSRAWRDPAHGTLIVQAGSYLRKVGRATLTIDPATHHVSASTGELVELLPDGAGEDPVVKRIVARRESDLDGSFRLVVATATADMTGVRPYSESGYVESRLGSWMADCYKAAAGADVAFQKDRRFRADIAAGPVTLRDLFELIPFDAPLMKVRMSGARLRSALDRGVDEAGLLQVAGIAAEYRRASPRHQRLASVAVGGAPLDDAKTYTVATLDSFVDGGGGGEELGAAAKSEATGLLARDVLRACAEKQKSISPPALGRLKELGN
jgi:5'-nucleotidase/UDP-sugar diphosphatase